MEFCNDNLLFAQNILLIAYNQRFIHTYFCKDF